MVFLLQPWQEEPECPRAWSQTSSREGCLQGPPETVLLWGLSLQAPGSRSGQEQESGAENVVLGWQPGPPGCRVWCRVALGVRQWAHAELPKVHSRAAVLPSARTVNSPGAADMATWEELNGLLHCVHQGASLGEVFGVALRAQPRLDWGSWVRRSSGHPCLKSSGVLRRSLDSHAPHSQSLGSTAPATVYRLSPSPWASRVALQQRWSNPITPKVKG